MKTAHPTSLYSEIKQILQDARQSAYRFVNFAMVIAYWEIGKRIVEHEQLGNKRAGYGEALLKELSQKLTVDFGKGFALASLKNYRQFYLTFSDIQKGSSPGSLLKEYIEIKKLLTAEPKFKSNCFMLQKDYYYYSNDLLNLVDDEF
jgi:hypothetical protein